MKTKAERERRAEVLSALLALVTLPALTGTVAILVVQVQHMHIAPALYLMDGCCWMAAGFLCLRIPSMNTARSPRQPLPSLLREAVDR